MPIRANSCGVRTRDSRCLDGEKALAFSLLPIPLDNQKIDRFFRKSGKVIVPFTVGEILNEQIAHRLALPIASIRYAR